MKRTPTILRIATVSTFEYNDVVVDTNTSGSPMTKLRFAGLPAQPPVANVQRALAESSPA